MNTMTNASAVGAVRVMETSLLSQSDIDRMIGAKNVAEIAEILTSCGRNVPADTNALLDWLDDELLAEWTDLKNLVDDSSELEILLYKNDFHNLKAALKALIMNVSPKTYYVAPTNLDLNELGETVAAKAFDSLPKHMREVASEAYSTLTTTLDGQLADAMIDVASLCAIKAAADTCNNKFLIKYAQLLTACADIKTAYRCSNMRKEMQFMQLAVCGSSTLDKSQLTNAAENGIEDLLAFLSETQYVKAAECLENSPVAFEKWCDDILIELAEQTKSTGFGIEPLVAYFIAKEMEIKNLRILIVCKNCRASEKKIAERMRKPYV